MGGWEGDWASIDPRRANVMGGHFGEPLGPFYNASPVRPRCRSPFCAARPWAQAPAYRSGSFSACAGTRARSSTRSGPGFPGSDPVQFLTAVGRLLSVCALLLGPLCPAQAYSWLVSVPERYISWYCFDPLEAFGWPALAVLFCLPLSVSPVFCFLVGACAGRLCWLCTRPGLFLGWMDPLATMHNMHRHALTGLQGGQRPSCRRPPFFDLASASPARSRPCMWLATVWSGGYADTLFVPGRRVFNFSRLLFQFCNFCDNRSLS